MLGRLFKFLIVLLLIGGVVFVGFAYLSDLDPMQERVTEPIELELPG